MSCVDGVGYQWHWWPVRCFKRAPRSPARSRCATTNSVPTANTPRGPVRAGTHYNALVLELNGRIDRQSGALTTLLKIAFAYKSDHKRGYDTARNSRAQPLRFTRVASHGRCPAGAICAHTEVFTVEIPEAELRQAAPEGYRFKVLARLGPDAEVIIPRVQIAALLARIDGERLPSVKQAAQR